jgi:hypothetical protein
MEILKAVPAVEEKINSGALNLTNLELAQKLFIKQKASGGTVAPAAKLELLERLENQTTRAAEKIVYEIRPDMKPKKNALHFESIEDDALREKLLRVKGLFAHTDPYISLTDLLHKLCDQELEKKTKLLGAPKVTDRAQNSKSSWRRRYVRKYVFIMPTMQSTPSD